MDRRKFIKSVGTAGAAAFVLPRFSIASAKSPNSKLNVAFVGVGGVGGALVATLGLVAPSVIVILIVAAFLKAFRDSKWVNAAFYGLRPASTALVAAAGISVVPIALLHSGMTGFSALNWPAIALAAVLLVCTNWVPVVKKWHPIVFIGISALVGVLLKF